jgi:hypothetical protein
MKCDSMSHEISRFDHLGLLSGVVGDAESEGIVDIENCKKKMLKNKNKVAKQ